MKLHIEMIKTFHKINESLMKNNVSKIEISKEPNQTKEPSVTCTSGMSRCVYWLDTQSVKVWWRYNTSDLNGRQ